ncbi:MAG TPA: oligoribonuclease [Candidatus Saccharimonadales bacterium]|nr:oligoribonuclease [Candidatus Saccharimonadales bacterium]
MTDIKHTTPTKILWLDLEMTGLDATKDRIIEVGAIMTNWDFNELGTFESGIKQDPRLIEEFEWLKTQPALQKQMLELSAGSPPEAEVLAKLMEFVNSLVPPDEIMLLAGNSIHMDRGFIRQWWPELEKRLHYRMLDVSAWKVVMQAKYGQEFAKKESHRALDDIRESMAELQDYLKWVHVPDDSLQ